MIVGVDEVGRGPWAGPLVMAAVVLGTEIEGLTDSKKLTKKRREELSKIILAEAHAVGIGWVSAGELDELGMSAALTECCLRALRQIKAPFHEIIIDGTVNLLKGTPLEKYVTTMKKADLLVPSVSAASIVAKVARDAYMTEQDGIYPGYKFGSHAGYGTAAHSAALELLGPTPLHRMSFAPLAKYISRNIVDVPLATAQAPETTRSIGNKSEDAAANELTRLGYEIIERNWKTRYCEVDIICKKNDTLFFAEVKHRKNKKAGDGLAAITPKKLEQMKFAAEFYVHINKLSGKRQLMAVSTSGEPTVIEAVLELN
jgi:ribonuclease HII